MGVRLKNPNGPFPPQGYTFDDPHTAMHFDGDGVDLHSQSLRVAEHRRANPKVYNPDKPEHFDLTAIKQEIVVQVCARQPTHCEDDARPGQPYPAQPEPAQLEIVRHQGKVCKKCGSSEFTPIRCRTCGGARIKGYKCVSCGLEA